MKHKKTHRKFNRDSAHRKAMLRNLATSLLRQERITTTLAKAKDLRGVVEPLISRAAEDTVHNRRQVYNWLYDKAVVHKLFSELGPRYTKRPGGYTRVLKIANRVNDAAPMAIIELVDSPVVEAMLAEEEIVEQEATPSEEVEAKE